MVMLLPALLQRRALDSQMRQRTITTKDCVVTGRFGVLFSKSHNTLSVVTSIVIINDRIRPPAKLGCEQK